MIQSQKSKLASKLRNGFGGLLFLALLTFLVKNIPLESAINGESATNGEMAINEETAMNKEKGNASSAVSSETPLALTVPSASDTAEDAASETNPADDSQGTDAGTEEIISPFASLRRSELGEGDETESAPKNLADLESTEGQLLDQLAGLQIGDPNYRAELQRIGRELQKTQSQIQWLRQQNAVGSDQGNLNGYNGIPSANQGGSVPGIRNIQDGLPDRMETGETAAIPESGENSEDATPEEGVAYLTQLKEDLTVQLRQLQQTLSALGPQDEALNTSLREQQTELVDQLKGINTRLSQAGGQNAGQAGTQTAGQTAEQAAGKRGTKNASSLSDALPKNDGRTLKKGLMSSSAVGTLPNFPQDENFADGASEISAQLAPSDEAAAAQRVLKAHEAAAALREAGLNQLADQTLAQAARLTDPNYREETAAADETPDWVNGENKTAQILSEVNELKQANEELRGELAKVQESLVNVETQLKLLSRQMVDTPTPKR